MEKEVWALALFLKSSFEEYVAYRIALIEPDTLYRRKQAAGEWSNSVSAPNCY